MQSSANELVDPALDFCCVCGNVLYLFLFFSGNNALELPCFAPLQGMGSPREKSPVLRDNTLDRCINIYKVGAIHASQKNRILPNKVCFSKPLFVE